MEIFKMTPNSLISVLHQRDCSLKISLLKNYLKHHIISHDHLINVIFKYSKII